MTWAPHLPLLLLAVVPSSGWGRDAPDRVEFPQIRVNLGSQDPVLLNKGSRIFGEYYATFDTTYELHLWPPDGARDFGDVDGDGRLDEINREGVFLGHGDGQFGILTCAFVRQNTDMAIAAGDLDQDGRADVVLGTNGIRAYVGNGDGTLTFLADLGIPFEAWGIPPLIRLVDLDGDGDLDLFGGSALGPVLAFNKGSARFERSERRCIYPQRATVCDVDRDGLKEFVTIGNDPHAPIDKPQVSVFLYRGAVESLGEEVVLPVPGLDKPVEEVSPFLGVTVGDLDRDGKDDVLCSGDTGTLVLFRGRGDGAVEEPSLLPIPRRERPRALLLEDLDLDGHADLLAGYYSESDVYWGLPEGLVDFSRPTVLGIHYTLRFDVVGPIHRTFIRGDADDDGTVDVADARAIVEQVFLLRKVECGDAMDVDDSGRVNVTDAVRLLLFLFAGGPAPPYPYPTPGGDPTTDAALAWPRDISGDLGCSLETFEFDDFAPCSPRDSDGSMAHCRNPIRQFLDVSVPE